MYLGAAELGTIKYLLWGRSWPLVTLPPDALIQATDGELRKLGFIPNFLQGRDPGEVFAFLGWSLGAPQEEADLTFFSIGRVKKRGFRVTTEGSLCPKDNWLHIDGPTYQRIK